MKDTYNPVFEVIKDLNTTQRQINIIRIRTSPTQQAVGQDKEHNTMGYITQQGVM
jgi:hypothetical protein